MVFPLIQRPFLEIAKEHKISEQDVIHRIARLKDVGLIRQISAIFDTRRIGYKSALIAFSVETDKLDEVALKLIDIQESATTMKEITNTTCGLPLLFLQMKA